MYGYLDTIADLMRSPSWCIPVQGEPCATCSPENYAGCPTADITDAASLPIPLAGLAGSP